MQPEHERLSIKYFEYLAARFPVMCASDEFLFLPRVRSASHYYDQIEDLGGSAVEECIETVKKFRQEWRQLTAQTNGLEDRIDAEFLDSNMAGLLMELEKKKSWRHNPLFYLKIGFIGLDHALTKPAGEEPERVERTLSRMHIIPRLLRQAAENLHTVPESYYQASLAMAHDCGDYLAEIADAPHHKRSRRFLEASEQVERALREFTRFLQRLSPFPDSECIVPVLEETLKDQFLSMRSPAEIFEIAREEWHENLDHLKRLQAVLDSKRTWEEIYHGYSPRSADGGNIKQLYAHEMRELRRFFLGNGFDGIGTGPLPEISETPTYLRSVRSSASFSAAFSRHAEERDIFYITTRLPMERSEEAGELLKKRLRRECKFLTAHETFPGHFVLDATRRNLDNPVRSQVESPLFYEGWAYYVESLLVELGYVTHPMDELVDRKRRLWRAARCQIDIGLTTGRLAMDDAVELLTSAGFSVEEARAQVDRFQLNPGYQLCYSLGRYEIMRLRETYGNRLGVDAFHRELLQGGEIPFHRIAQRLESFNGNTGA